MLWHASKMPKLWSDTLESHRDAVAAAIMDTTAHIAAREGLHALTMARIAQEAGIGRATLYKYFSDVHDILIAWHKRQISVHLDALHQIRRQHPAPYDALASILVAFGKNSRHRHTHALGPLLHKMPHVGEAHDYVAEFVAEVIAEAIADGSLCKGWSAEALRSTTPYEMARYALAALSADVPDKDALIRLTQLILRGMS